MNSFTLPYKKFFPVLALSISVLFSSCGGSDSQTSTTQASVPAAEQFAAIATTPYTGSGAYALIGVNSPNTAITNIAPTSSTDLAIASNGEYIYRLERLNFGVNGSVVKFSLDDPQTPIYQYSADDPDPASQSNPSDIVFLSATKAYLLRNLNNKIWIINPSATTESGFKTGEIDLSAYSPDGVTAPMMSRGVIVGNKLFVILQRLDSFYNPSNPSYIAVIDTDTDTEINTGYGSTGFGGVPLKGIELSVNDPAGRLIYNGNSLYVAGTIYPDDPAWGTTTWTDYSTYSGIQSINATTYEPNPTIIYNAVNTVTFIAILNPTKGYFVEYISDGNTALRSFNPTTGVVATSNVAGIGDSGDRDISDIALDNNGNLWIADFSTAHMGMYILDTATDTIETGPISTGLNPVAITFCEK
jgi:hypothetical protein